MAAAAARLYIYVHIHTQRNGQLCRSACLSVSLCFSLSVSFSASTADDRSQRRRGAALTRASYSSIAAHARVRISRKR